MSAVTSTAGARPAFCSTPECPHLFHAYAEPPDGVVAHFTMLNLMNLENATICLGFSALTLKKLTTLLLML